MPKDDFPALPSPQRLEPHERYELLLRAVRYLLARNISFTRIEEALAAGGVDPSTAERLVELIVQDLEGAAHAPGAFDGLEVPEAALAALGFVSNPRAIPPHSLLAVALGLAPAPEFAFATSSEVPTRAARRGTPPAVLLVTALVVGATVLAVVALALR